MPSAHPMCTNSSRMCERFMTKDKRHIKAPPFQNTHAPPTHAHLGELDDVHVVVAHLLDVHADLCNNGRRVGRHQWQRHARAARGRRRSRALVLLLTQPLGVEAGAHGVGVYEVAAVIKRRERVSVRGARHADDQQALRLQTGCVGSGKARRCELKEKCG
eukprot:363134-Chlamydomonas_euryale.AAC.2